MTLTKHCAWIVILLTTTTVAQAQPRDDDARRRQLILQAGTLRDRGDHAGSLRLLREAAARRMSPSLRLFIAQEEAALGQHFEAFRDAQLCAAEFEADPTLGHRDDFLTTCRSLGTEVSQHLARVTVRVATPSVSNMLITLNGEALSRAQWDVAHELEPGDIVVEARAPGYARFTRTVHASAATHTNVRIELVPEGSIHPFAPPGETPPVDSPTVSGRSATSHTGRWVLLGSSAALFLGASVFYVLQNHELSQRDALCRDSSGACVLPNASSAQQASTYQSNADSLNTATNIALGLGVAAAVGGVVWWIVDSVTTTPSRRTTIITTPSSSGFILSVQNTF
jgi:hypothetical protein